MAAQVNFNEWSEPTQTVFLPFPVEEGCLRQVHLPCHVLHPGFIRRAWQKTNGCRVTGEDLTCKCIDLKYL
jgi:hypothetical protein